MKTPSTLLVDAAYNEARLPSLRLARSSHTIRRLAKALVAMLTLSLGAVAFAPWQQTITGSGQVVAYAPLERRQTIQAPITGRIVRWGEGIVEGTRVTRGQTILEIQDLDRELLGRLQQQLAAMESEVENNRNVVKAFRDRVQAFHRVRDELISAADQYIQTAVQRVLAAEKDLLAEEAALEQEELDYERHTRLAGRVVSQLDQQRAERRYREAQARVARAQALVQAARNEEQARRNERNATDERAGGDIDAATAQYQEAHARLARLERELRELEVRIARQQSQVVTAPRDGFILRLMANEEAELVREGDPLFELVPDTADRAVEIWVTGNDAPLVSPGRHVRLQFEGWPAVQFAGWPSVAVGTFGGEVAVVDSTDDGRGRFRILITPDPDDQPWPSDRFLRQGVRANGWVLLNEVGLGYEIWRRLNGFPPAVDVDEPSASGPVSRSK